MVDFSGSIRISSFRLLPTKWHKYVSPLTTEDLLFPETMYWACTNSGGYVDLYDKENFGGIVPFSLEIMIHNLSTVCLNAAAIDLH